MNTLTLTKSAPLNPSNSGWDLTTTPSLATPTSSTMSQDISVSTGPYAIAQDVASIVQTWQGEAYYDTGIGIPYSQSIMAYPYAASAFSAAISQAAMQVPGVVQAQLSNMALSPSTRTLSGIIGIIDTTGAAMGIQF